MRTVNLSPIPYSLFPTLTSNLNAKQLISVIMTTMVDDKNFGLSLGASEYLLKPINLKELLKVLQKYRFSTVSPRKKTNF